MKCRNAAGTRLPTSKAGVPSINSKAKNHESVSEPYEAQVTFLTGIAVRKFSTCVARCVLLDISNSDLSELGDVRAVAIRRSEEMSAIGTKGYDVLINPKLFKTVKCGGHRRRV